VNRYRLSPHRNHPDLTCDTTLACVGLNFFAAFYAR
jgi:hypothetical protein